jgi:hypothetical protein
MFFYVVVMIVAAVGLVGLLRPWPFFVDPDETGDRQDQIERNVALEFGKWVERQAAARGLTVRGVARPVLVVCPKCGKESNYFVYPDELCGGCWRATLAPESTTAKNSRS